MCCVLCHLQTKAILTCIDDCEVCSVINTFHDEFCELASSLLQEMADLQERLNLQTKELQDALSQRKLAMSEYSEVSDKYVSGCFLLFLVDKTASVFI